MRNFPKVFITVRHTLSEVIQVQSFIRVAGISLAIFASYASCENSADEPPSGKELYLEHCDSCHATISHQVPSEATLRTMSRQAITRAMQTGLMKLQAQNLSGSEMDAIARYLSMELVTESSADVRCDGDQEFSAGPGWLGWGNSLTNDRAQKTELNESSPPNPESLELAWAFAVPGADRMRSQPTVGGGVVFIGSQSGSVYALDAKLGCVWWTFNALSEVRGSISVELGKGDLPESLYFGDFQGHVYKLEALTGKLVWRRRVDPHPLTTITGSPVIYEENLFIPLSSTEIVAAINSDYECCTFRGGIVAVDTASGETNWRLHLVDEPYRQDVNHSDVTFWGPSGVPVWSSPTVDEKRRLLYFGTGQNYSPPATAMSDAIIAVDMSTGRVAWHTQTTSGDMWNGACVTNGSNCPVPQGPDFDFGAPPILVNGKSGNDYLLAGQKSGMVFALDPSNEGHILWKKKIGRGGHNGGIHWGMAADENVLFVPIADIGEHPFATGAPRPGIHALDIATGEVLWSHLEGSTCSQDSYECFAGFSAPISLSSDILFAGGLNGVFHAYSSSTGGKLWEFNTRREFISVNQLTGRGGTIDGSGPVIVGDMLYLNSGYGRYGKLGGNVLLAFSISKD